MKLIDLVRRTEQQLLAASVAFGHGTSNAWDEAAWITLWAVGLPLDADISSESETANQPVSGDEAAKVQQAVLQRIALRKPFAYIIREAWLQGVPFYVDERAIIPRSLIAELLADGSIDVFLRPDTQRVLDLCTGNGSLAVLAALAWPEVQVDAADISPDARAVARINVEKHGLQQRIRLIESDGLAACPGPYDLILCNPPYVNAASMTTLPAEYRVEPELALAGGVDGMDFIRPLLAQAAAHLAEGGVLVLEIGHERGHFEAAIPRLNPVWIDTSAGGDQVLLLTREALMEQAA
jgi:ribosomal protein L3 glutamine methyltransferase